MGEWNRVADLRGDCRDMIIQGEGMIAQGREEVNRSSKLLVGDGGCPRHIQVVEHAGYVLWVVWNWSILSKL